MKKTEIKTFTGVDNQANPGLSAKEARHGKGMNGGPTDISHSISGGKVKRC